MKMIAYLVVILSLVNLIQANGRDPSGQSFINTNQKSVRVPNTLFLAVPSGKVYIAANYIWYQNSNVSLNDSVKIFKYKHRLFTVNFDFLIKHVESMIAESRYDQVNHIINHNGDILTVSNVNDVERMYTCSFNYVNEIDDKTYSYSFQYPDNLVQVVKTIHHILLNTTSNLAVEYNDAVQQTVVNVILNQKFFTYYYTPSLPHATIKDLNFMRYDVLCMISIRYPEYKKYLEIGTFDNELFIPMSTDLFATYAVGVDPNKGGTLRMTSDAYFENNHDDFFDVVFIDGLHEAQQAYRDILNSLRMLRPNGMILVHDCSPHNELAATYPRPPPLEQDVWNGDTWKAIVAIRALRDDLDVVTIDVDQGIAVIRKISNDNDNSNTTTSSTTLLSSSPSSLSTSNTSNNNKSNTVRIHGFLSDDWKKLLDVHPMHILTYKDHLESHRVELLNLMTIQEFETWLKTSSSVSQALNQSSPSLTTPPTITALTAGVAVDDSDIINIKTIIKSDNNNITNSSTSTATTCNNNNCDISDPSTYDSRNHSNYTSNDTPATTDAIIIIYIHVCQILQWRKSFDMLWNALLSSGLYNATTEIRISIVSPDKKMIPDSRFMDDKMRIVYIGKQSEYERPTLLHMRQSSFYDDQVYSNYNHTNSNKNTNNNKNTKNTNNTNNNSSLTNDNAQRTSPIRYLYLHTKGVSHFGSDRENDVLIWIQALIKCNIHNWRKAIHVLSHDRLAQNKPTSATITHTTYKNENNFTYIHRFHYYNDDDNDDESESATNTNDSATITTQTSEQEETKTTSLETYGCFYNGHDRHYVGNFWWATSRHIQKLSDTIPSYYTAPEDWVMATQEGGERRVLEKEGVWGMYCDFSCPGSYIVPVSKRLELEFQYQ